VSFGVKTYLFSLLVSSYVSSVEKCAVTFNACSSSVANRHGVVHIKTVFVLSATFLVNFLVIHLAFGISLNGILPVIRFRIVAGCSYLLYTVCMFSLQQVNNTHVLLFFWGHPVFIGARLTYGFSGIGA